MKPKFTFFIVFSMVLTMSYAQVAINDTGAEPDASAILDVQSENKGILIPQLRILDINSASDPVNNPAEGLLIYNTGTVDTDPGFYFWTGTRWNQITNIDTELTEVQLSQFSEAAELYENNDFGSPTNLALQNSSTYYGWMSATEGEAFGNTYVDTGNAISDQIIVGEDGLYQVQLTMSFGGSNNTQVRGTVFHTPVGQPSVESKIRFLSRLHAAGDLASASTNGLIRLSAGDALDVRFNSTSNGKNLNIYTINFIVNKVAN
jgi:hypothetical protein